MLKRGLAVVLLAILSSPCCWAVFPTETVFVAMPDGVELATDYYLPAEGGPAWPVIVARTPYARGIAMERVERYIKRGFACVMQDVRGTGHSKGDKNVFYADGWRPENQDGRNTIDWVRKQPWCNGRVATYGESAVGVTSVLLAPVTENLACQVIRVTPSNFYHNMAYQGGVWRKNLCEAWLLLLGLGQMIPYYKSHTTWDDFWAGYDVEAKAPEITAPGLHIGGWYDIFQQGTINNFVSRQNNGGPGAKGNQMLIMRWSAHVHDDCPDFRFPENRRSLDTGAIENRWYDYWLKGEQNGVIDEPRVRYYTYGDDRDPDAPGMEWRTADTWPPFATEATRFFLADGGGLAREVPVRESFGQFAYDPANPHPTRGGANLFLAAGPWDQRVTREGRSDYLLFATAPLDEPLEATGAVTVELYVSTDAPDTDFTAKLLDIYPEGDSREILILDGIRRVKFRDGFDKPAPLLTSPDEIVRLTVELWSTSWVFNKGHRIGVQVSSSNYPRFEKNPNTGDNFPDGSNQRVANNRVHFGGAHASSLILPVRPGGPAKTASQ